MIETHPFKPFSPPDAKYLILGSFAGRQAMEGTAVTDDTYDWFYGTKRNQFWPILEEVYGVELRDIVSKQRLFTKLGVAITDIIYQCERRDNNNSDASLVIIKFNEDAIAEILDSRPLERVLFTSRFVEKKFRRSFKDIISRHPSIDLVALPSPSPRYARMSKEQKVRRYKQLLPGY